ncbi:MAG: hypothetical protein IKQ70_05325 [Bacteroidales bacterium]|nr:hypothetical protein [Bacteroidales bacterium]
MSNINTAQLSTPSKIQSGFYKKSMKCFFFQSKLFEAQMTELYDDLWLTVTAVKNLRWQVNGYYHEMNVKQNNKLASHFVDNDDKTNRPNLYRACIEQSWEQQEYCISRNLLTNIFALFEGWIEMLLPLVSNNPPSAKQFQFPGSIHPAIAAIQQLSNSVLVTAFYNIYITNNYTSKINHIEHYLKVYRYFKECRNCIIHQGGRTNQNLVNAYSSIQALTTSDLDVTEMPDMEPVFAVNELVKLRLRGVIGLSQIVIKIVEVLDMEFIKADKALDCFISQIKEFTPRPENLRFLTDAKKREKIVSIMKRSGFPSPNYNTAFYQLLERNRIITT